VSRVLKNGVAGACLDQVPEIHHADPVADVPHDRKIVRYEKVGETKLFLDVHHQIQDLSLYRNVQGRDRFVGDDQLRFDRQGPGDADSLALAATELMGIAVHVLRSQADPIQKRQGLCACLGPAVVGAVQPHGLGDDIENLQSWIERGIGVLKDHLDRFAHRDHLLVVVIGDVLAVNFDPTAGRFVELDNGFGNGGFAASAFADQAEHLAPSDAETDPVDGMNDAPPVAQTAIANLYAIEKTGADIKALLESADFQQMVHGYRPTG